VSDTTQMFPGDDPNRTVVGGIDPNKTQVGGGLGAVSSDADPYRTQMPSAVRSVALECLVENSYALAPEANHTHILARLTGVNAGGGFGQRMPVNVCLVLDRSGSMEGPPLDYMKQACGYVVDLLEPSDILSIVAFEDTAQVIMPARRVVNRALIKEHIMRLDVGNTTNLYDALALAGSQVSSVANPGYVNRALLFTDGEPTAGNKDFSSIVGQVVEQKSRGITFTALGFGYEYNEELLSAIAKRSGGNYYYITRPELIPEIFRKELESLMMVTARNVRLRIRLSRWSQVRQVYGKLPTYGTRSAEVTLADLEKGETQTALIQMELGARPGGTYRVAVVEAIYDDSVTGRTETVSADAVVQFTADAALLAAGENPMVKNEIQIAEASRNLERTVMGMKTQQISTTQAVEEMEKTRMMLLDQGKTLQAQDMQAAIDQIRQGAAAEKTLIGIQLDREKTR